MTTKTLNSRVAKLEAQRPASEESKAVHQIAAYSDEEQGEKIAALIAGGTALETDMFIVLRPLRATQ